MIKDGICRHARNHDTYHNQNSICVMHNYRNYYTPAIEIGGVLLQFGVDCCFVNPQHIGGCLIDVTLKQRITDLPPFLRFVCNAHCLQVVDLLFRELRRFEEFTSVALTRFRTFVGHELPPRPAAVSYRWRRAPVLYRPYP